jgi:(R,R)-butanediol dehydrogenase/meso-butanediol dehydrogenase/diacetyl reductase
MQAARYYGRRDVRIEAVDEPALTSGGVRIDVDACGICGTDVSQYASGPTAVPTDEPHPVTGATAPVTLGHEFSGLVVETGEAVERVAVGDRVVVNPIVPCRECTYCRHGSYRLCDRFANVGLHGNGGGFAENAVVPASSVVRLPAGFPVELGPLVEPLAVSLHAVRRSGLTAGDRVAVFGAGPIGLGVVQAARAAGARDVLVSEPREGRRTLAGDLGGDVLLDPGERDAARAVREATGTGVDVAFEVAGLAETVDAAIRSTRKGGTVVSVAAAREATVRPNADFVMGERSFVGSFAYECVPHAEDGEFATVIRMLADGRLDGAAMVGDRIGLDDLVAAGLDPLADGDDDRVKVLVDPDR